MLEETGPALNADGSRRQNRGAVQVASERALVQSGPSHISTLEGDVRLASVMEDPPAPSWADTCDIDQARRGTLCSLEVGPACNMPVQNIGYLQGGSMSLNIGRGRLCADTQKALAWCSGQTNAY